MRRRRHFGLLLVLPLAVCAGVAQAALEEVLPYAIALEVQEAWGDHLSKAFFATPTRR
jgi:hypothetical protein